MESVSDAKYTGLIKRIGKWTMILGIANAVFYLLHDIIGGLNYPGYNWMEQAVSAAHGYRAELLCKGPHYDYLACISRNQN